MPRHLCIFQNCWKTNTLAVTIHILSTSFLFSLHFQPYTVHLLLRQLCCLTNWPVVTHSISHTHHSLFFLTHNTPSLSQAHRECHTHLTLVNKWRSQISTDESALSWSPTSHKQTQLPDRMYMNRIFWAKQLKLNSICHSDNYFVYQFIMHLQ